MANRANRFSYFPNAKNTSFTEKLIRRALKFAGRVEDQRSAILKENPGPAAIPGKMQKLCGPIMFFVSKGLKMREIQTFYRMFCSWDGPFPMTISAFHHLHSREYPCVEGKGRGLDVE